MCNIYVVGRDYLVEKLFLKNGFSLCEHLQRADLVVFTGGEDVQPSLYGCKNHPSTFFSVERDKIETSIISEATRLDIPMVGICRGGQLLNVVNGGKMHQHVFGHTREHLAHIDGEDVYVTSTHHQMMIPGIDSQVLGNAIISPRREFVDEKGEIYITRAEESSPDIEVVFYPLTNSLCFQPHPEFDFGGPTERVFFKLLDKYLGIGNEIKTSYLEGAALDWAVAKCEGWDNLRRNPHRFANFLIMSKGEENLRLEDYNPSTNWSQGGPIIEREEIEISVVGEAVQNWCAIKWPWDTPGKVGKTPLIAAMRCYVASKLGDKVDVPEELL